MGPGEEEGEVAEEGKENEGEGRRRKVEEEE